MALTDLREILRYVPRFGDKLCAIALHVADVVPVVPPVGCDGEGRSYRLNSDAVAVEIARSLQAVKLIYITTHRGIPVLSPAEPGEEVYRHLPVGEAELLVKRAAGELPV